MKGLEELRKELAEYLNRQGVRAMTAWESGRRAKRDEAVAVVSIKACEGGPAGFQDYLGERLDEKSGKWEEWYGRNHLRRGYLGAPKRRRGGLRHPLFQGCTGPDAGRTGGCALPGDLLWRNRV